MSENEKINDAQFRRPSKGNKLNLRVDDEVLDILNTISFEDDEPVSRVVRKAIKQYNTLRKNRNNF